MLKLCYVDSQSLDMIENDTIIPINIVVHIIIENEMKMILAGALTQKEYKSVNNYKFVQEMWKQVKSTLRKNYRWKNFSNG